MCALADAAASPVAATLRTHSHRPTPPTTQEESLAKSSEMMAKLSGEIASLRSEAEEQREIAAAAAKKMAEEQQRAKVVAALKPAVAFIWNKVREERA